MRAIRRRAIATVLLSANGGHVVNGGHWYLVYRRAMPQTCCAFGCTNQKTKDFKKSFYRIPIDPRQKEKWIAAISRSNWTPALQRSLHYRVSRKIISTCVNPCLAKEAILLLCFCRAIAS